MKRTLSSFFVIFLFWTVTLSATTIPPLKLSGIDEKLYQLDQWSGKTIVLNFWATYCIPCKQEIKTLIKYQEKYADQGLQVVGVGVNEDQSIKTMSLLLGINYPVLLANIDKPEHTYILTSWGNNKHIIPYTVVINRQGKIVYQHKGILKPPMIEENILPLLSQ